MKGREGKGVREVGSPRARRERRPGASKGLPSLEFKVTCMDIFLHNCTSNVRVGS